MSLVMHCKPCGKSFTGPVSYKQHMGSDKHKKKILSLNILNNSSEAPIDSTSTVSSTSLSSNTLECSVCSLRFNSLVNFQNHSLSPEHAQKVMEKSTNNLSSDIDYNSVSSSNCEEYDSVINKTCDETDMILPSIEMCRSRTSNSYCNACSKSFSGPEPYKQHIESAGHIKKVQLENTIVSFEDSDNHLLHRLECMQKVKEKYTNILSSDIVSNSTSSSNCEEYDSDKSKTCEETDMILPEVEMFRSRTSFSYCDACSKSFSGPEPYKQHIESAGHIKKVQLQNNVSPSKTNQTIPDFSCDPCQKIFSGPAPYIQHMSSEIHRKKITNLQYIGKYEVDLVSETNKFKVQENPLKPDQNIIYCKVCDIPCSGLVPYKQHLEGIAHLKKMLRAENGNGSLSLEAAVQLNELRCRSQQFNEDNNLERDILLPGLTDKDIQLELSVTMFSPDDEIDFDKPNSEIDSDSEDKIIPNVSNQIQIETDVKSKIKLENGEDNLMEKREEKCDAYEVCKFCDITLFNKDEARDHYESLEHFKKRWK